VPCIIITTNKPHEDDSCSPGSVDMGKGCVISENVVVAVLGLGGPDFGDGTGGRCGLCGLAMVGDDDGTMH
jgi:hypothetical protein